MARDHVIQSGEACGQRSLNSVCAPRCLNSPETSAASLSTYPNEPHMAPKTFPPLPSPFASTFWPLANQ